MIDFKGFSDLLSNVRNSLAHIILTVLLDKPQRADDPTMAAAGFSLREYSAT
jgi:hypothetical protein